MKNDDKIVVLALIIICAAMAILTIRNDSHYNKERQSEANKIASQDSFVRKQMDSLSTMMMDDVKTQLDSIRFFQKENNKIMNRGFESIKKSLDKTGRTGQQKINSKK